MPTKIRRHKAIIMKDLENNGHVMKQFYKSIKNGQLFYNTKCVRCNTILSVILEENTYWEYNKIIKCDAEWYSDFVTLAQLWYNGQWSAMYKFQCNGGKIFSKEHADDLIKEIEECIYFTRKPREIEELKLFRAYVREKKDKIYDDIL